MKAMIRAVTVVAALIAFAAPAMAVDFVGYFRDGWAISGKGGPAATFQTPGMDYKLRLGNENDNYGEWGLEQTVYKDQAGVEFKVGVMFAYYTTEARGGGADSYPFGIQQNYVTAKFPQWLGAKFWAGKMYYLRENIDMIDKFYLNVSDGPGIGVTDIDIGMGKLAFSVLGVNGTDGVGNSVTFLRPDVRWYGLPVWTNGTLTFDANIQMASKHTDAPEDTDGGTGFWGTAEWHQEGILGGWNTLTLQYATGMAAGMGPGAPGSTHKKNTQFAIWDQLLLAPMKAFAVNIGGSFQQKHDGAADANLTSWGIFARPVFYVTDYFKLQGDLGYTNVKPEGGDDMNLIKWTFAPTLSPAVGDGTAMFVRPELRLYVTGGAWNDAAQTAGIAGGNYGTDKSGILYGAQVETWF